MAKYIINNTIIFDSTTAKLCFTNGDDTRTTCLSTPAARCLEYLMMSKGTVVTKSMLLEVSWKSFGFEVTDNSVNQVIFQIRKCFYSLDMEKDIIVTVPRLGYQFNPDYYFEVQEGTLSDNVTEQPPEEENKDIPDQQCGPQSWLMTQYKKYRIVVVAACVTSVFHLIFTLSENVLTSKKIPNATVDTSVCALTRN